MSAGAAMRTVDITAVVTFHREGLMAHHALGSVLRCCEYAELQGITTRVVATLDEQDSETRRVVQSHPMLRSQDEVHMLSYGDVALSRNRAVQGARSRYVAIFDGDDQISTNWLSAALAQAVDSGETAIVHPRMVVTFGAKVSLREQPDQPVEGFERSVLLGTNLWNVCAFALAGTFLAVPYVSTGKRDSGFGFEDWHWNCETVAAGYKHLTAPRTAYFERRKHLDSLNLAHQLAGAVIRPSRLFRCL